MNKKIIAGFGLLLLIMVVIALFRKRKNTNNDMKLKYFKLSEFDSPDAPGSGSKMQGSTLKMLDKARGIAGVAFKINSGYRTKAHNASLANSVANSSHLYGLAADIACTSETKEIILKALYQAGFRRFGIGNSFIHVDNDSSKPQNAVWGYPSTSYTITKIAAL